MGESETISMDAFRVLTDRARLGLTMEELESLKPMYDHFARQTAVLSELELDAEDMALRFPPDWDFLALPQTAER